jgi:hypothetical protein
MVRPIEGAASGTFPTIFVLMYFQALGEIRPFDRQVLQTIHYCCGVPSHSDMYLCVALFCPGYRERAPASGTGARGYCQRVCRYRDGVTRLKYSSVSESLTNPTP